jgi:hypothetical protein
MVEPFSQITIDHIDLPTSESGYTCLLVIIDRATRLVKAVPCKTHTMDETVNAVVQHWIFQYGVPRVILSDKGTSFVNRLMKAYNRLFGIDQSVSTPYNPQSHGLVERANQTLEKIIRALLVAHNDSIPKWDRYINHAVFVINTTPNETTGFSPYELVYGRKASYPLDRLLYDDQVFNSAGDYFKNLIDTQRINYAVVHSNLLNAAQKNAMYNSQNEHRIRVYNVGDLVYKAKNARQNKLEQLYDGPYTVKKRINDLCYMVQLTDMETSPLILANIRQLKPFIQLRSDIKTAAKANKEISDIMKDFDSTVDHRKPISQDDYLDDEDLDLLLNA